MECGAGQFPSLTPRISELYGASGGALRVGETYAYAQDLDDLEREERALENMVQELVNRRAAMPIGVKFHREGAGSAPQQVVAAPDSDSLGAEMPQDADMHFVRSSSSEEEEEEEEEDDLDADEMMEEEEEDTTGRATIVRGEGQHQDEDSIARDVGSGDESMEMEDLPLPSDWPR